MLDMIKTLLNIIDDSKDTIINYYIGAYSNKIKNMTGLEKVPSTLEHIVVELTVNKMSGKTQDIKKVKRGNTEIEYNTDISNIDMSVYEDELARYMIANVQFIPING
ncbi:phage head-tail connector protein [Anaerophilus nitritogenes]|uniref:phage head-tail connector protein n=1 Tax=Anaerophilus nitritogenes TaxID=2498136 RepID=UPI00101DEAA6|nr:phage head-tail connector protein [Anaerophilus nitritogenes]